jgi:hypothetical protein
MDEGSLCSAVCTSPYSNVSYCSNHLSVTHLVVKVPLGILAHTIVGAIKRVDLTPASHTSTCQEGCNEVHACMVCLLAACC